MSVQQLLSSMAILSLVITSETFGQAWPYGDPLNPPSIIQGDHGFWERLGSGTDLRGASSVPTEAEFWYYGGVHWKGKISGSFNSFNSQPPVVYLNEEIHMDPGVQGPWLVSVTPGGSFGNAGNGYHQSMIPGGSPPPVVNPYTLETTRTYFVGLLIRKPIWAPDYYTGGYYIAGYEYVTAYFGVIVPISTVPYRWLYY